MITNAGKKLSKAAIAGIVIGSVVALFILLLLLGLLLMQKKGKKITPAARRRAQMRKFRRDFKLSANGRS